MIYYLLVLCLPIATCCQYIAQKQYNLKMRQPNVILFSVITAMFALLFFVITSGLRLTFDRKIVPYALTYGICYSVAWVGTVFAVRYGPIAISSLILSCSLIFPTIYGIATGDALTWKTVAGLVLLFLAMTLVNLKFEKKQKKGVSVLWLISVSAAFLGNGMCSLMQNICKRHVGPQFTHEFMILALSACIVILTFYGLVTGKHFCADLKKTLSFAVCNGGANAIANFLTFTIIGNIPNTIFYPTSSALNMTATFGLAYVAYKERFSKQQYLGYALGVMAVVILNLS